MMKGVMPYPICPVCGSPMEFKTVSSEFTVNGKHLVMDGIEAYVCGNCGEEEYTPEEAKMITRIYKALKESKRTEISVLNLSETAEYLRVSNQTIYNMIKDGRIKAYKVGREWRFMRSDIISYLNTSTNESLMAAKGGTTTSHDMDIILAELKKRSNENK